MGQQSPYEQVHYHGVVIPNTAPNHLALCSLWHHGPRPNPQHFCLVELGCGDGANLLPLAFYAPGSTFLGIDNSRTALDRAREASRYLGLENVHFVLKDIRNLGPADVAPCDYVIGG